MIRIIQTEIKKLNDSKIWWMLLAGAVLPGLITFLSFLYGKNLTWLQFFHVSMLIFNVQSLLTFSAFASYLCAREYEQNTQEIMSCYPYPKYYFVIAKLIIIFSVIATTIVFFAIFTVVFGEILLSVVISFNILILLIRIIIPLIFMHFFLIPFIYLLAELSHLTISGVVLGIFNMCLCMMLYSTKFIQYIPPCIPFVLSDHLLGMNVMVITSNYCIHWSILILYFVISIMGCFMIHIKK